MLKKLHINSGLLYLFIFNPFSFGISYVVVQMWLFYSFELLGVIMVDAEVGSPSYLWG